MGLPLDLQSDAAIRQTGGAPPAPYAGADLLPNAVKGAQAAQDQTSVEDALKKLNDTVKLLSNSNSLRFSIDDDTGSVVVKVMDGETDEVIRQIPSEEVLAIAKAIDQFRGMLIKEQA
ncbi:flagellar protein FlaG [Chitiniphilus eburneus]|uniref:Flagellar protein FlaG n=2 Tax=Chitiniphilus eburneus TaxID=2571148 RepID=A0A4U0PZH4_9NEIS|nr:flagellar protein FlaG [Chitiniphilus eburneus]